MSNLFEQMQELFDALSEPFPNESVEWRVGQTNAKRNDGKATKGQALAYIDARTVMDRLDSVCGLAGWQRSYSPGVNGSIVCNIGIRVFETEWIWKADGAGATDMEGEKGALSDAFKRAAVNFGIGRYLYDIESPWVDLDEFKRIKKEAYAGLNDLHAKASKGVRWGPRSGVYAYRVLLSEINKFITQPSDAVAFEQRNAGLIAQLPVAMKNHLKDELARIGASNKETA